MLFVVLSVVDLLLLGVHVVVVAHVVVVKISKVSLWKVLMMLGLLLLMMRLLLLLLLLLLHFKIIRIVWMRTLIRIVVLHGVRIIYFGVG